MAVQADQLDQIVRQAISVMEDSKYQIFEIYVAARTERDHLAEELEFLQKEIEQLIQTVDRLEVEFRRARIRLAEVSRHFSRYDEEDIRRAYETAAGLQAELIVCREKEKYARQRREELGRRLRLVEKTAARADALASQINVVLEYLSGNPEPMTASSGSGATKQQLGFRIILAQEEERKRIARDLHDGVAQSFVHLSLRAEIAQRFLQRRELEAAEQELSMLRNDIRAQLEEVRRMIFNLRPPSDGRAGLVESIRKYVREFEERSRIRVDCSFQGEERRLAQPIEVAVFRMVQESLSNVLKHARASYASVELVFRPDSVQLTVRDNGVGLPAGFQQATGYGLVGMRERAELLNGRLDVESRPNEGTKLVVRIPTDPGRAENTGREAL
ncbi:MAG: hypothetical protein BLM47_10570 [Candidatus Reconcilbacillus cellulovorans]|uniref:Oxygen sensor histidine kinase NreB n=1 Tax=Candidatus Reconcilbacillus cellulovorans TaxID=1906605 RepID=A0A2A6DZ92_9BACL|nr:MAG: hypothetical protein BLM47_10570 [Candidatus Reconcilbacillus cellulovorans]